MCRKQLQDQARLVLEENQVLIEQLELKHDKAKEMHSKHIQEGKKKKKTTHPTIVLTILEAIHCSDLLILTFLHLS